jgi:ketosteroid isomerase-like protein
MNKIHCFFLVLSINAGLYSCYTGPEETKDSTPAISPSFDKQKATAFIDSVNKKFTEQVRNGDSVALAAHYHPEAELLFSNSEPIKGTGILSAWGSVIRMGVKEFTFTTTDITGSGDLLVETGSYEMKAADNSLIDRGKYVVVWKQQDGQWKLFRDIGNTSLPAPGK